MSNRSKIDSQSGLTAVSSLNPPFIAGLSGLKDSQKKGNPEIKGG
jgi:hypothetical protein